MSQAYIQDNEIYLETAYEDRLKTKGLPGSRWDPNRKVWRLPATPATAYAVLLAFPNINVDSAVRGLCNQWMIVRERLPFRDMEWPRNLDRKPWNHQRNAYTFLQNVLGPSTGSAGLFAGMGTGKTLTTVAIMAQRRWKNVLIVCPKNMIQTWAEEIDSRITDGAYVTYPMIESKAKSAGMLQDSETETGRVFIVNYAKVWSAELGDAILNQKWDAVILDEAQAIKSAGSKVSMFFDRLGRQVPFRMALTGTPLHDKPTDVYGIYRFLDPGIFGTSFAEFKDLYTYQRPIKTGVMVVVGYRNLEDMSTRMYQNAFRVSEDVLDLPESVESTRYVTLSPKARTIYREIETEFVSNLSEGTVLAGNILTQLLRLQQVAAGHVTVTDLTNLKAVPKSTRVDTSKAEALREVLEELEGEPVVVFAKFREDLKAIQEAASKLKRRYYEESGSLHEWRTFQYGDKSDAIIGVQIDAGSSGIDLTRSAYAIYYTVGYSLGTYEQSLRRVLRPGQDRAVRYIHLVSKGTVDETILHALKAKKDLSTAVVDSFAG